jgi:hypothetical protein
MKTTVTITISFEAGQVREKAEEILGLVGCTQDEVHAVGGEGFLLFDLTTNESHPALFVDVTFNEGDERIQKLCELLAKHGIKADVETTRSIEYSEEDLQTSRLLQMSAGSDYLQSITSELGTKYDLKHACPHCGTGAKQIWYERVKRKDLPLLRKHRAIMSRDDHILVDATVRKMLINAGITGISFAEVHARDEVGDWNPIDRYQILIESTLPPMRGELTADDEKDLCKLCRRGGHPYFSDERYHQEDLVGMKDFNLTWEWFGSYSFDGNARHADFSHPRVLVTPKVMNLFREARVKTFKWTPVVLAD